MPSIEIIDSEQMSFDMRQSLATLLFSTMSCSYETALGVLGLDVEDELQRRIRENERGYDTVFRPRVTAYTTSGAGNANGAGMPPDNSPDNPDRQQTDKARAKDKSNTNKDVT